MLLRLWHPSIKHRMNFFILLSSPQIEEARGPISYQLMSTSISLGSLCTADHGLVKFFDDAGHKTHHFFTASEIRLHIIFSPSLSFFFDSPAQVCTHYKFLRSKIICSPPPNLDGYSRNSISSAMIISKLIKGSSSWRWRPHNWQFPIRFISFI
jgi:hypothetical protein